MKLSEKIALGRMLCTPVPYYQDNHHGGGCALGMAARAVGASMKLSDGRDWYSTSANVELTEQMAVSVSVCPVCSSPMGYLGNTIAHAFNEHVFGDCKWTLDQLIDWIRSVEPEETDAVQEQSSVECSNTDVQHVRL